MKFEGIYTPVITPHLANGDIDEPGFAAQVEHLVAAGVHGTISGGSIGEYYVQSIEERIHLARVDGEVIAGRE